MTMIELVPSHARAQVTILDGSDGNVAYAWRANSAEPKTIDDLLVFHDCDHNVMLGNATAAIAAGEERNIESIEAFIGWSMTGAGAHDLIAVDPLHIEASVYWPECCGIHGFIRDGRWVSA